MSKSKMTTEYISTKNAREDLGDKGYFAIHRWLVEKGYRNLDDIFITKDQLQEFIKETSPTSKGLLSTAQLWGQTREHLRGGTK